MTVKHFALTLGLLLAAQHTLAKDLVTIYDMALERYLVLKQALAQRNALREATPTCNR